MNDQMNTSMPGSDDSAHTSAGADESAARRRFYSRLSGWGLLFVVAVILTIVFLILGVAGGLPPNVQRYVPELSGILDRMPVDMSGIDSEADDVDAIEEDLDDLSTDGLDKELGDIDKELAQ